jgi:hypothetical protein
VGAGDDVSENNALEIAAGDSVVVEKDIVAMLRKILKNRKRPRNIGSPITQKDRFFGAFHTAA